MEATAYIVRCSDGSYYTGLTKQEIEARVWEHNEGLYDGYTKKRRPVTLVFTENLRPYHRRDCTGASDQGMEPRQERSFDRDEL